MLTGQKSVFVFALVCQRIEADKGFIDEPRMAHHEATLRQGIEELPHQRAKLGLPGKIIGTGESGVECDIGARGA